MIDHLGQHIRQQEQQLQHRRARQVADEDSGHWRVFRNDYSFRNRRDATLLLGKISLSYARLVPRVRESPGHKSHGGISRCGSPRLRWVMVEAAHTALCCCPAAKQYFERLRSRKYPHAARVALARKLLGPPSPMENVSTNRSLRRRKEYPSARRAPGPSRTICRLGGGVPGQNLMCLEHP